VGIFFKVYPSNVEIANLSREKQKSAESTVGIVSPVSGNVSTT